MKILFYSNRKTEPKLWDVSTADLELGAFLELFRYLDKEWGVYADLDPRESGIYRAAKKGNATAARDLLQCHKEYEYERYEIFDVRDASLAKIKNASVDRPAVLTSTEAKRTPEANIDDLNDGVCELGRAVHRVEGQLADAHDLLYVTRSARDHGAKRSFAAQAVHGLERTSEGLFNALKKLRTLEKALQRTCDAS